MGEIEIVDGSDHGRQIVRRGAESRAKSGNLRRVGIRRDSDERDEYD